MRHYSEIDASAEEFGERDGDEGCGSVIGFHLVEGSMNGPDEFFSEGIGLCVEQHVEDFSFLLEDDWLGKVLWGNSK